MKERYINPLTDFGFKKLFGTEPNKVLLIDFLNQILPDRRIKDLTYSSGEKQGLTQLDRKAIFDLYCIGNKGEKFIVEMQKAKQNYFKDRSVFYASFPIQEQGKKNKWDYKLDPIYSIGILDFIFDDHKNEQELLHVVELKNTHFDKWMYVFTHLSQLQDRPKKLQDRVFTKLFEAAEIAKFTPKEREAYEESLKYYRDIKNVVDTSREEGREEGREERNFEIVKQMKGEGFTNDQIRKITGLRNDEIERLMK